MDVFDLLLDDIDTEFEPEERRPFGYTQPTASGDIQGCVHIDANRVTIQTDKHAKLNVGMWVDGAVELLIQMNREIEDLKRTNSWLISKVDELERGTQEMR